MKDVYKIILINFPSKKTSIQILEHVLKESTWGEFLINKCLKLDVNFKIFTLNPYTIKSVFLNLVNTYSDKLS